ncbi:Coenzyme F420 hydrogenase/dehydrogenase, beta subunit C-terminal domain [Cyanobium sp. Candia 9D4]|uniref:Coenzyme F420 hydrogenase/dehydrogenase, beta subunit C-terminal domain n=1 Tax=Cyanobium sp. Candia 9D4 TaxID=2823707 RepID=UPI0020CCCF6D|nr:Coenzyme F420 hydrogenase/dehydrogenase, beta subunit C-terminal domain [Cyanobium sp. Candia 9D4]MCP9934742.1 Coenzyme F420 hydrogenase/dehydrogenase, beta subunit C-terminal domain [Cyanobium sp. Candia 9D4]
MAERRTFGSVLDRFLKKRWSPADIDRYVGTYREAWLTHATDGAIRERAASGGTTSAVLIEGLRQGLFDGAVVCVAVVEDGKVRPRFRIATDPDQILAARGSKYVESRFLPSVLPLLRSFEGRVAVVGLPCDIAALRQRCGTDPVLAAKLALTIALVCGHNSRTALIDAVTSRLEKQAGQPLRAYRFRIGHWRGHLEAEFADGSLLRRPTKTFNDYQNMFFFCERKCLSCHDHYGYAADLTMGDIWLFRLKNDPIKHTAVITRTEAGQALFDAATRSGAVAASALDIRDIMDGQARIGPAHYNVTARARAGRWLGLKIPDRVQAPVTWHDQLNAFWTLANVRLSESAWGRRLIFALPRPVIRGLLYLKKGLESVK